MFHSRAQHFESFWSNLPLGARARPSPSASVSARQTQRFSRVGSSVNMICKLYKFIQPTTKAKTETETKTKTKSKSKRPRPKDHDHDHDLATTWAKFWSACLLH